MDGWLKDPAAPRRLQAVDALRGLIIILMALDHANHFIAHKHSPGEYWGGAFPTADYARRNFHRRYDPLLAAGATNSLSIVPMVYPVKKEPEE